MEYRLPSSSEAGLGLERVKGQQPVALITTREAAARLGLSPKTLCKLRVVGGGPRFAKLGAAVRYDLADIEAWAASRKQTSTSQNKETN